MTGSKDFSAALVALWRQYRDLTFERLRVLEEAVAAVEHPPLDPALSAAAESAAHKLAGSLGTFGLESGTRDALAIEQILASTHAITSAAELRSLFQSLSAAIAAKDESHRLSR